jgi:hypothetical protein
VITWSNNSYREIRDRKSWRICKRMNFIILFRITLFTIIMLYFFSLFNISLIFRLIITLYRILVIILHLSLHLLLLIMLSQNWGSFFTISFFFLLSDLFLTLCFITLILYLSFNLFITSYSTLLYAGYKWLLGSSMDWRESWAMINRFFIILIFIPIFILNSLIIRLTQWCNWQHI